MAISPEEIFKLGAEALGWDSSTTEGKAVIAEDLALLELCARCARTEHAQQRKNLTNRLTEIL